MKKKSTASTNLLSRKRNAIKEAGELVKKYEKQSENVKNNREFEAINKEIEMQQLEGKLAEKHIRDANEELSEKARQLEFANKQIDTKDALLNNKKGDLQKIITETEKEENHFNALAQEARKGMDERLALFLRPHPQQLPQWPSRCACRPRCMWWLLQCHSATKAKRNQAT